MGTRRECQTGEREWHEMRSLSEAQVPTTPGLTPKGCIPKATARFAGSGRCPTRPGLDLSQAGS